MPNTLTHALEKLDNAIDQLDKAVTTRLNNTQSDQTDLFNQLDDQRTKTDKVAKGLDNAIDKIETLLTAKG